jgi:hypothetical protein
MKATVHVAGPVQRGGAYQQCTRCGHALIDYTGSTPMVVEGEDLEIGVWPEGSRVAVSGAASWVLSSDALLDPWETECQTGTPADDRPDKDACRNCRRPLHWVDGVGWLHGELPQYAHEENTCVYAHPVSCTLHKPGQCPKGWDLV